MNRQGLIKLLQSNLSDEDVLEILKDIVCPSKSINLDMYRPTYQPTYKDWPKYEVTCNV
jgi:hypothetical protein